MVVLSAADRAAEAAAPSQNAATERDSTYPLRRALEALLVPSMALVLAAGAFSLFLLVLGKSPADFFALVWRGAFGRDRFGSGSRRDPLLPRPGA